MAVATTQAALAHPSCDPCSIPHIPPPSTPSTVWTIPIPVQSPVLPPHTICIKCSNVAAAVGGLLYLFYCFRSCTCVYMCM